MKISSKLNGLPTIKLSQIEDLQGNLKDLNKTDFEKLKTRIDKHGFKYPLYLWKHKGKYYNLDGNQRKRVIMSVWGDIELPYIEIEAKNQKEAKKEILAISSQYGKVSKDGFDEFAFDFELEDWAEVEMETTFDGWMDKEIPEAEEDDYEEPDDLQVDVVLGDLITFEKDGKELHRLLCGDSTDSDAVEKVMNGSKADMVFTDPPYGVKYQSNRRSKSKKFDVLKNDDKFITDWIHSLPIYSQGFVFVWTSWKVLKEWMEFLAPIGDLTNMIIWDKGGGGIGDLTGTFISDFEISLVYNRGAKLIGKRLGSVWEIGKDSALTYKHPTQKPVNLASTAIENILPTGQIVLDLFLGSGSTMAAAHQLNRKCYGLELDPRYCQVIIDRMQKLDPNLEVKINGEVYAKKEAENVEQS